ncbi:1-deoxy-D-xylulose 5-phosphate reductoisomerase [Persephonella hydrogeniphila]|uniref:1-deoxy-D-xylulose 5-phosphate reductoisomerase n=1 Tax=Persephonella hydrogeniphila TaxID=198703 RepID=A0A285NA90_9AQUI|nr:1-deoxy-D-xylulose-5-phosphate reductoisomerase [Persephonella hydrogeniphila]SNZ06238.1 1-deoxy-D-xylulose 5-phosphate reductoisomerase [Persephonella hydrogeniphila]
MKTIAVLGSTGSIGTQTLDIVRKYPDRLKVKLLAASKISDRLLNQIEEFRPEFVYVAQKGEIKGVNVLSGDEGLEEMSKLDIDLFINGISGIAGIKPTYLLLKNRKKLATANKEAIICLGEVLKDTYSEILPIDSEHSAIFQSIQAGRKKDIKRIILTASGGPFWDRKDLNGISVEDALKHPKWKMGKKVTVDSATLMNKGLEIIEAHYLFNIPYEKIQAVIHPQSIVHGLVEFIDGSIISQLSCPDMRIPISYAISYPERWETGAKYLDLFEVGRLEFYEPDEEKFPLLKIAKECGKKGSFYPVVLTVADELAVNMFLKGVIQFTEIPFVVEKILQQADFKKPENYEDVIFIIEETKNIFKNLYKTAGGKIA